MTFHRMPRTRRRLGAALALVAGTFALAACGDDDGDDNAGAAGSVAEAATSTPTAADPAAEPAPANSITIKLIAFKPTELEVPAGTTVTWIQDDVANHTVTSGVVETSGGTATAQPDGAFDSGTLGPGDDYEFTFAEAGEFPFYCAVHPATMTGVVRVS